MGKPETRVVLALDFDRLDEAEHMIELTQDQVGIYKIGSILFTAFGSRVIELASEAGAEVFLDLKFHDIPNTVGGAVRAACSFGVGMLTVHASGGIDMMRAALDGAYDGAKTHGHPRPKIIGVTMLTSLARGSGTLAQVLDLAASAHEAGIDGVVCSPLEVSHIKRVHGDRLLTVVPGIRLGGQHTDDQARVGAPGQAARDGADFIVVGRSVTKSRVPKDALAAILEEVKNA